MSNDNRDEAQGLYQEQKGPDEQSTKEVAVARAQEVPSVPSSGELANTTEAAEPQGVVVILDESDELRPLPTAIWAEILRAASFVHRAIMPPYIAVELTIEDDRWYAHSTSERDAVVVEYFPSQRKIEAARNAMPALQAKVASLHPNAGLKYKPDHPQKAELDQLRERTKRALKEAEKELAVLQEVACTTSSRVELTIRLRDVPRELRIELDQAE